MSINVTVIGKNLFCPQPELVNIYCKSIGDDCRIGTFVEISKDVEIGDRVSIGAFCFIPEGWKIGNDVFIGPQVLFLNDKYPPSKGTYRTNSAKRFIIKSENIFWFTSFRFTNQAHNNRITLKIPLLKLINKLPAVHQVADKVLHP